MHKRARGTHSFTRRHNYQNFCSPTTTVHLELIEFFEDACFDMVEQSIERELVLIFYFLSLVFYFFITKSMFLFDMLYNHLRFLLIEIMQVL